MPSGYRTSRSDRPCVYSWYTTSASSPPFTLGSVSPLRTLNRYICIVGEWPSGGVPMFALLKWFSSGSPLPELAPSIACPSTLSAFSKLPAAAVKP